MNTEPLSNRERFGLGGARGAAGGHRHALVFASGTLVVLLVGALLVLRADRGVNHVPLASSPLPVSVVPARAASFVETRAYVGAVQPWVEADVGPQYLSAYVDDVRVRPGDVVSRGDVLAKLDCSNADAASRAVAMQARAVAARGRATANEATRVSKMAESGYAATNDAERKNAEAAAEDAQLLEARARLDAASLAVRDCVLRAPFDGEIAARSIDPGEFVRPGQTIVSVVDRRTVRVVVDAPEKDFDAVAPKTPVRIRMLATGAFVTANVSRRAPKADPNARTVHVEIDVADPTRSYPVATTAVVTIDVGAPVPATEIPLYAATVHERNAKLFVVENGTAHARTVPIVGERGGSLFLDPSALPAGTPVVTEGRTTIADGATVRAKEDAFPPSPATSGSARGAGHTRPF